MMTVAELLELSRAKHMAYRRVQGQTPGAHALRKGHVEEAYSARKRAHEADPGHTDPAWASDTADHGALMAFYEQKAGIA